MRLYCVLLDSAPDHLTSCRVVLETAAADSVMRKAGFRPARMHIARGCSPPVADVAL